MVEQNNKYREMISKGAKCQQIYNAMKKDNISSIECLRTLQELFSLSAEDVKRVMGGEDVKKALCSTIK